MTTDGSQSSTSTIDSDQGGTVVLNGANPGAQAGIDVTYTPPGGFSGVDGFRYEVADNLLRTDTAGVQVIVGANAIDDDETTARDRPVDIDILGNDVQFDDPVTVTLMTTDGSQSSTSTIDSDQGGTVVLNGANPGAQAGIDVTYTPPAGFTGQDSFRYEIQDSSMEVDTASVRVSVVAPTAGDDAGTTTQDTSTTIDILDNDVLFEDPVTVTILGGDMSGGTSTNGGTIVVNGANPGAQAGIDVTYTPPTGFSGDDTFSYRIEDDINADEAGVTVSVAGRQLVPVAPDAGVTTGESQPVDIVVNTLPGVSLGVTPVIVSIARDPASGTTIVFGQTITYTPTGFPASDTFDYTIEDANGLTATGTISLSIGPALVPVAIPDTRRMQPDESINIAVTDNDVPGSGDIEDHTVTIVFEPISGTAVVEADNTITYTPDPGTSGTQTFTYNLTDVNMDMSPPALVTVDVEAVPVQATLPKDDSSALAPWTTGILAILAWLRGRRSR